MVTTGGLKSKVGSLGHLKVLVKFESTPKALASSSPGLFNPGKRDVKNQKNAESVGMCNANSFSVRKE
jgi:hypothetical protein